MSAPVARLSRRWSIAAAHRLHSEQFDAAQNAMLYGKCNHEHGHGHNYVIEVTVAGVVDPVTGMVTNLAELDAFARERVLGRFDHQNLNLLPEFAELVPTTENFARVVEAIFRECRSGTVERVHLEETRNNSVDLCSAAGERAAPAARER